MFRRLAILTVVLFAPLVAVAASRASSAADLAASLINGNYGNGSGQLVVNWMNHGSTTFNGAVDVSLTVPSSVTLEGPDYLGTCSPDNTTDGCQSVSYSSSAEKLTLTWTGIVTPGQTFYTKVVYQAAAQVGSLPPGQLVETISDTDPTDIGTADKTSIIQAGTAAGTGTTTTGGGTTPTGTTPTGTTPTGTTMGGGAAPTGTIPTVVTSAVVCVAPSLMRMTLARAKLTLRAAHCGLGNVDQRKHRARHHVLRVIGQSVRVGSRHPRGYLIRIRLA